MPLLARLGKGLHEAAQPLALLQSFTSSSLNILATITEPSIHTSAQTSAQSDSIASTQPTSVPSFKFLSKTNNVHVKKLFAKYRYNKPAPRELMHVLHRFTATQGYLPGQHILAKVLKITGRHVLLDPQFFGINRLSFDDLAGSEVFDEFGNPKQGDRSGQIEPGDYVKVKLTHTYTPFGDMHLEPSRLTDESKMKLIWQELGQYQRSQKQVQGRVLNACRGGYAVGVAGFVALLPYNKCLPDTARQIGVLQEFYITKMDDDKQLMFLSCTKPAGSLSNLEQLYSNIMPEPAPAPA